MKALCCPNPTDKSGPSDNTLGTSSVSDPYFAPWIFLIKSGWIIRLIRYGEVTA